MGTQLPLAPVQASEFAVQYDWLFYLMVGLTAFFTTVVMVMVLVLAIRYRRGSNVDRSNIKHENLPLELTWTIIPFILAVATFWFGARQFIYYKTPPKNAMEVYVVGKQWMWHLQHAESGIRENNALHVPTGVPIRLTMISQDVIHAFYIPEFRLQYQVVPGHYTESWFVATKPGVYHMFCAMYCGTQHSEMGGYVYVMTPQDYARWSANGGNDPQPQTLVERGADIFTRMACGKCHSDRDTIKGPSLDGLYGKTRRFTDGSTAVADDAYIHDTIEHPQNHVVAGYGLEMEEYAGQISEQDMISLVAYVKSLGVAGSSSAPPSTGPQVGNTPSTTVKRATPRMAVGELGAEPPRQGVDNGQLAVGALGTATK